MKNKKIKPPYIPKLKGDADTTYFESIQELQMELNSIEEEHKEEAQENYQDPYKDFEGFTFDGNSTIIGSSEVGFK